jgi:DNA-binding MarR family transcriptional regulator
LGTVLDFMRELWALDHSLQRISRRMKVALGLSSPERLVIRVVGRLPGLTAGRLARVLHLHPSTVTPLLKGLEKKGLLLRLPDSRDRRRSLLALSAKGKRLDVETEGTVEVAIARAMARLPGDELEATIRVLGTLKGSLERSSKLLPSAK